MEFQRCLPDNRWKVKKVDQLLRRPRSSARRHPTRKVHTQWTPRPFIDRYSMMIDAGQAVRVANRVRRMSWRGSRRRPRVPRNVLGKQLAKMLVHAEQIDRLGQASRRVPEHFHENGPEKQARRPPLLAVDPRQPEERPQALPRYRLGTITHLVEAVHVREQPLGESLGSVEPPAKLLLALPQLLRRHEQRVEIRAAVGPGVLRRFLAARRPLDEPACLLQPLV